MALETEKKVAHFRIVVRDEKTMKSKSFPIYDSPDVDLEAIIQVLKRAVQKL